MEEKKKNKIKKWLIWGGFVLLIVFVVVTSTVLHAKKVELDRIKNENDRITEQTIFMV